MKTAQGSGWVISCTERYEETVAFFRDVMGFAVAAQGVPVTDRQFTRYAHITLPNGGTLEIVEPSASARERYRGLILSIAVDDVARSRREMEDEHIEFLTPIFDTKKGSGWTYFRAPDGQVYQIEGPYEAP